MNPTAKLLLDKLIHKVFPEFSNKVTWTLITIGVAVLIMPAPTYLMILNFLVDFYNSKANANIKLIDIGNITPGTGTGLTLILSGLIYHLAIKGIQLYGEILESRNENKKNEAAIIIENKRSEKIIEADRKLFESFIALLPTHSSSIELLKDHNFGASYHNDHLKDIEGFNYKWGKADQIFHDAELNAKSLEFLKETKSFLNFLAISSGFIGVSSRLSIPTDDERANDWEWSQHTNQNVEKANKWSNELHDFYCDFIASCKEKLLI